MKISIPLLSSYIVSTSFSRIHAFMSLSFPHVTFMNEVAYDSSSSSSKVKAVWDPIQQIYVGGVVPATNEKVVDEYLTECKQSMHHNNPITLRIFGYGSLCWSPGTGALAKEGVVTKLGRVMGYKRCWAQRSTDHRGIPSFPGIVCTLLTDEELRILSNAPYTLEETPSMTEGIIYEIPGELLEECLTELDFREKGVSKLKHLYFLVFLMFA
jgi:ChaC-like protein